MTFCDDSQQVYFFPVVYCFCGSQSAQWHGPTAADAALCHRESQRLKSAQLTLETCSRNYKFKFSLPNCVRSEVTRALRQTCAAFRFADFFSRPAPRLKRSRVRYEGIGSGESLHLKCVSPHFSPLPNRKQQDYRNQSPRQIFRSRPRSTRKTKGTRRARERNLTRLRLRITLTRDN